MPLRRQITRGRVCSSVGGLARRTATILAAALVCPSSLSAQAATTQHPWVFSGGTFLTQDGGWNYGMGLELGTAREQALGDRLRLQVGAIVWTQLAAATGEAAIFPPYPDGLEHAAALRVQVRSQPAWRWPVRRGRRRRSGRLRREPGHRSARRSDCRARAPTASCWTTRAGGAVFGVHERLRDDA